MNIKEIEGNIYFFADDKNSIKITDEVLKDFCKSIHNIELKDLVSYCKNKKITKLTSNDFREYCLSEDITLDDPIIDVGNITEFKDDSTKNQTIDDFLDDLENGKAIENAKIPCIKTIKSVSDTLQEIQQEIDEKYPLLKEKLDEIQNIEYSPDNLLDLLKVREYRRVNKIVEKLGKLLDVFKSIEDEFEETDETPSFDGDLAEELTNNLSDYIAGLSPNELEEHSNIIKAKQAEITNLVPDIDEGPDFSKMTKSEISAYTKKTFRQTKFYQLTTKKINPCKTGIKLCNKLIKEDIADDNTLFKKIKKLFLLKDVWDYQINGFNEDLNSAIETCPATTTDELTPTELLDEVPLNSKFDITSQSITSSDLIYWVKFATLLTAVSWATPQFWSTGLITPVGPIPLGTTYINLGVVTVKIPIPVNGIMMNLPFIIVPNLAITGSIISPFVMFISLAPFPIGPIAPNSIYCLFSWRSALVPLILNHSSTELKPTTLNIGSFSMDISPRLTLLLSILIRDDLPPYERLKLTNIPFVLFSLMKIVMQQRIITGLP